MKRATEAVLILAVVAIGFAVQSSLLKTIDRAATSVVQQALPRWLDLPFSIQSLLGSVEVTTILLLAFSFLLFKPSYRAAVIVLFFVAGGVEWLAKHWIHQPGPPAELSRYVFFFSMPTGGIPTPFSFPSGHAARSTYLATIIAVWLARAPLTRRIKAIILALVGVEQIAMLIGRVYLADHWSSDVIAGALIGMAAALPILDGLTGQIFGISGRSFRTRHRRSSPPPLSNRDLP
ncbi:MAG: phosphatase PAP2 family protein [Chloroflexi bacterium]|nr:phosphatase PAP2 family protein [Chloroflexota bacterium]